MAVVHRRTLPLFSSGLFLPRSSAGDRVEFETASLRRHGLKHAGISPYTLADFLARVALVMIERCGSTNTMALKG